MFLAHFRGAWTLLRTFAMVLAMILHETCGAFVWDLEPEKNHGALERICTAHGGCNGNPWELRP